MAIQIILGTLGVNFINIYVHVFFVRNFVAKAEMLLEKLPKKDICMKKAHKKMLMKLTAGGGRGLQQCHQSKHGEVGVIKVSFFAALF